MKLTFTPEQESLRKKLRDYFSNIMTSELRAELNEEGRSEGGGPLWKKAMLKLGKDGWIGIGWPKAYGGMEKTAMEQYLFFTELSKVGFPLNFLTSESVGPALAQFGSEELKQEVIPKILRGEINICIGYSEPSAGTDLAALKTRAVLEKNDDGSDSDHYIINGNKIFTSLAEWADYVWLACRTGDVETGGKHATITMFLIPMDAPGISLTPINTLGSVRTNATYYEDVRVHKSRVVGELNQGWNILTSQLNRERLALSSHGPSCSIFKKVCEYAAETTLANGERLIDQGWVKMNLAKARQGIESLRLICYKQAWAITTTGTLDLAEASAAKVYGSEFMIESTRYMMEVLGQGSALHNKSQHALLEGQLERLYRTLSILTFGGGTNEIQRDLISMFGLSMPRSMRM